MKLLIMFLFMLILMSCSERMCVENKEYCVDNQMYFCENNKKIFIDDCSKYNQQCITVKVLSQEDYSTCH